MGNKFLVLFVTMLCLFSVVGNAQDKDSSIIVLPSENKVLYRGFDNPIYVSASGYSNITVTSSGKTDGILVDGLGQSKYMVKVPSEYRGSKVKLIVKTNDEIIGSKNFDIVGLPAPVIEVCGRENSGVIPKSAIKDTVKVVAKPDRDAFVPFRHPMKYRKGYRSPKASYKVVSFSYVKNVRGVDVKQFVSGNIIPEDIMEDMLKRGSGSVVTFIDIVVSTPSGERKYTYSATLE